MSRDKHREMAKDVCELYKEFGSCEACDAELDIDGEPCIHECFAKAFYNAGYRKASDVALEVIKKVEQILTVKIIGFEEDFFHGTAAHWDGIRKECYEEMLVELAELKKKYTENKGE